MLIGQGVLVSAAECARYAGLLDLVVRRHARECGVPVPVELAVLLAEMRDLGLPRSPPLPSAEVSGAAGGSGLTMRPMTSTAVAARLGITGRAVRLAAEQGRLPATRHGGRWLFDVDDVEEYGRSRNG